MDKRLNEISARLGEYSLGKFEKRLKISSRLDDTDAIINAINMLGDELKAITISRNYFNNIFNSVTDMVFILNPTGTIEDTNKSAEEQLHYPPGTLQGKKIYDLQKGSHSLFNSIIKELNKKDVFISDDAVLYSSEGIRIPVHINASHFKADHPKERLIIVTASDITYQIQTENLVLRAIIDTQEKERQRLAKDLHDSFTQQLSAIKFYISTTSELAADLQQKKILRKSNKALSLVIAEMRNICFNLMPNTLEEFGLVKAIEEFCNHFLYHKKARVLIHQENALPALSPELKIDLYRIIQELINNAIHHGKADTIRIVFNYEESLLKVGISDNGKGFNISRPGEGMGIRNIRSRVKSHSGGVEIISSKGKGTSYTITIPLNIPAWHSEN